MKEKVYRGSSFLSTDVCQPMLNQRVRGKTTTWKGKAVFATPHKYIALMFAAKVPATTLYSFAVPLNNPEARSLILFGPHDLQDCLDYFFAKDKTGYLYEFDADLFVHEKGLASGEVICKRAVKPTRVNTYSGSQILKWLKHAKIQLIFGGNSQ